MFHNDFIWNQINITIVLQGNMEEVYKNSLKMLSEISEQQTVMMREISKNSSSLNEVRSSSCIMNMLR